MMRNLFGYGALVFGLFGILSGLSEMYFSFFVSPLLDYDSNLHYLSYLLYLGTIVFFGLGIISCAITVMLPPRVEQKTAAASAAPRDIS